MRILGFFIWSLFLVTGVSAAPGKISQMPLGLQNKLPSNLMLLIDSSLSMTWDIVQQQCESQYSCDEVLSCTEEDNFYCNQDSYYNIKQGGYGFGEPFEKIADKTYAWGDRIYYGCNKLTKSTLKTCVSSRDFMAKTEAKKLVDKVDGFYTGLMHFHYNQGSGSSYEGAVLKENLILLDSTIKSKKPNDGYTDRQTKIKNSIDDIVADGGTPLAESFSAIGHYYAMGTPEEPIVTPTKANGFKMVLDTDDLNYNFVSTPKNTPAQVAVDDFLVPHLLKKDSGVNLPSYNPAGVNDEEKNEKMSMKGWCQKSFVIGLTDGAPSNGYDNSSSNTIEEYEQIAHDHHKSYLANITGAIWDMDLRPDLCDPLLLVEQNKKYQLSMTSCADLLTAIRPDTGLSVYESLELDEEKTSDDNLVVNDGTLHRYKNNIRSYLIGFAQFDTGETEDEKAVELMQKAARVGGGDYFGAKDGKELASVFSKILSTIESTDSSASGVGVNLASGAGEFVYSSRFNAAEWSGDLGKYRLIRNASVVKLKDEDRVWSTDDKGAIKNQTKRVIISYDSTTHTPIPFRWEELTAENPLKIDLRTSPEGKKDNLGKKRLNYLRGARGQEYAKNKTVGFRDRVKLLGDIVHSSPTFVPSITDCVEYDPENVDAATLKRLRSRWNGSITRYTGGKIYCSPARNKDVVYVNANDGMLHAFDDTNGKEIFAYIPSYIASDKKKSGLHYLTDREYQHRFYNDGTPWVKEDVWLFNDNKGWRTLLINTPAAGGRGVSLLDITSIHSNTAPKESDAEDILLWEFTHPKLGYTFAEPYIGPMRNGKWGVIIGNGYDSVSGTASVFIIDVEPDLSNGWVEGTNFYILETGVGQADDTQGYGKNGMSTVVAADVYQDPEGCESGKEGLHNVVSEPCRSVKSTGDADDVEDKKAVDKFNSTYFYPGYGSIDRLYGGDLYGNLWAFNVISTDPDEWTIDFNERPLFKVPKDGKGNPQPITAPPRIAWAGPKIMRCDGYLKALIEHSGQLHIEVVGAEFGDQSVIPYSEWDFEGLTIPDSSQTDENGETEMVRRGLSCGPNIMVTFGTGQFLTEDDVIDKTPRAFYSVWDNYKYKLTDYPLTISNLEERIFSTTKSDTGEYVRSVRDPDGFADDEFKATQWDIADDYGWYVNFDLEGERLTSSPFYSALTNEIMFLTSIPDDEMCGSGGISMFNRLDLLTGLPTKDVRVDKSVTKDKVIGKSIIGLPPPEPPPPIPDPDGGQSLVIATTEGVVDVKIVKGEKEVRGIVAWYEVKQ